MLPQPATAQAAACPWLTRCPPPTVFFGAETNATGQAHYHVRRPPACPEDCCAAASWRAPAAHSSPARAATQALECKDAYESCDQSMWHWVIVWAIALTLCARLPLTPAVLPRAVRQPSPAWSAC